MPLAKSPKAYIMSYIRYGSLNCTPERQALVQNPYSFIKRAKEQNLDIKALILDALGQADNDMYVAAKKLGITRQSLQYHMEKHGIIVKRCSKILINGEKAS